MTDAVRDEFDELAKEHGCFGMHEWSHFEEKELADLLRDTARDAEIKALGWALDAFEGGDYDREDFALCRESVEKRMNELKAAVK